MAPVETTIEGQYRRRDAAINAIVAYCAVVEGLAACRTNSSTTNVVQQSVIKDDPPTGSRLHVAAMSVFITKDEDRPGRCFLCVGEALRLELDDPCIDKLIHVFYMSGDLTKHFRRRHLSNLREDDKLQCRVCVMPLDNKMHLQNHARRIHGTVPFSLSLSLSPFFSLSLQSSFPNHTTETMATTTLSTSSQGVLRRHPHVSFDWQATLAGQDPNWVDPCELVTFGDLGNPAWWLPFDFGERSAHKSTTEASRPSTLLAVIVGIRTALLCGNRLV
ncbi:hypothetical protein B0T17DRAFT_401349 [Bombardia bombarda]|uniref:C2H2-type domain-containing protein n=1 Tax=Bombardia bombarda TaxID=252184 RepID=A0AA39W4R6_9PEZI|nr:hypothetical protein B0T17DRAFT_401349 [Bombardia bombarda]